MAIFRAAVLVLCLVALATAGRKNRQKIQKELARLDSILREQQAEIDQQDGKLKEQLGKIQQQDGKTVEQQVEIDEHHLKIESHLTAMKELRSTIKELQAEHVELKYNISVLAGRHSGPINVDTPKQSRSPYLYTLLSRRQYRAVSPFIFDVKGCNDAHIGLLQNDESLHQGRIYEVVIGGWSNSNTKLRAVRQGPGKSEYRERGILSCSEYRRFKITWDNHGSVSVFKVNTAGMDTRMLHWVDPNPFHVGYIGVTGGTWGSLSWIIQ